MTSTDRPQLGHLGPAVVLDMGAPSGKGAADDRLAQTRYLTGNFRQPLNRVGGQ